MYHLTDQRFEKAKGILEDYNACLYKNLSYNTHGFEMKLRECWGVGYQEIKDILIDLLKKRPEFRYLVLHYMQFQNPPGPVCEFHDTLAEQYGAETYYSDEFKRKKEEFWEQFKRIAKEESRE